LLSPPIEDHVNSFIDGIFDYLMAVVIAIANFAVWLDEAFH
jgi:hypothetical protein